MASFGIPSFKKSNGVDNIYGFPGNSEIYIYVPSKMLDDAKIIINDEIK